MLYQRQLASCAILVLALASCKKNDPAANDAHLTVLNVVPGGADLTTAASHTTIAWGAPADLSLPAGSDSIALTDVSNADIYYYDKRIALGANEHYTLFLTGASASAVESVWIKEAYRNYKDSVAGIRFINLSTGSKPIMITAADQEDAVVVASLPYLSYTDFTQYAATAGHKFYAFSVRDAATGDLITVYLLPTPRFANVTLAFNGVIGQYPGSRLTPVQHP